MFRGAVKIAILSVVVYKVVETVLKYGVHLHYNKHYPGDCRQVKGLNYGSEDLEVTKNGLAFITSGLTFPVMSTAYLEFVTINNIQGNIYLYDFHKPELEARKLKLTPSKSFNPEIFHPHGISLLEDQVKGEHLLYVINHPEGSDDAIEKFRYLPKTNELVHLKSFTSDKLHITNDLAVVEEDIFYVSNCLYFKNQYLSMIEQLVLPFGLGSLLFFNGTDFTLVDSCLQGPNGVTLSRDKRYLYINFLFTGTVHVYEVKEDSSLVQLQSADLYTLADNLHVSQSADALFTGAHPIFYQAMKHLQDPKLRAPSSVLKLPLKDGKIVTENITELFYDHGDLISGSSVAAVYNNKLIIGSVINKLVICDVNNNI